VNEHKLKFRQICCLKKLLNSDRHDAFFFSCLTLSPFTLSAGVKEFQLFSNIIAIKGCSQQNLAVFNLEKTSSTIISFLTANDSDVSSHCAGRAVNSPVH